MTETFYNTLAPYYKLLYPNWDTSIQRQAKALNSVIQEFIGTDVNLILDAACGIGTQSIGLAELGFTLVASDISSEEIKHAKENALKHNVTIEFNVADMRKVWNFYQKQFDLVIACDNAIPHLSDDAEILETFRQFYQSTKSGGGCIITVRDYAKLEFTDGQQQIYPRIIHPTEQEKVIIFDIWKFSKKHYEITTYLTKDNGKENLDTRAFRGGKYYCVEIPTMEKLFQEAGFNEVITLRDRFFQPLLLALK